MEIKVAYISYSFSKGGASLANNAMAEILKDHKFIIEKYDFKKLFLLNPIKSIFLLFPHLLCVLINRFLLPNYKISSFSSGLMSNLNTDNYDIFFLGWVGNGIIDVNTLQQIKGKTYIRVSDEFLLNANGFHYAEDDKEYLVERLLRNINLKNYKKLEKIDQLNFLIPSKWMLKKFENHFKNANMHFLPNPTSKTVKTLLKQPQLVKNTGQALVIADNLTDPRKGVARFLKNFKEINLKLDFKKVVFVGRNSQQIKFNHAGVEFELHDFMKQDKLLKIYKCSEYYIHCAYKDNSPNTLIEAISAGCIPVVFSDCCGALEYSNLSSRYYVVKNSGKRIEILEQSSASLTDYQFEGHIDGILDDIRKKI